MDLRSIGRKAAAPKGVRRSTVAAKVVHCLPRSIRGSSFDGSRDHRLWPFAAGDCRSNAPKRRQEVGDRVERRMGARALQECTSHDLALESAYVSTLEKRSEYLLRLAREAAAREDGARLKVQKAKTEHKKVETWRDRLVEADVLEEAAVERRAADDVAARIARRA